MNKILENSVVRKAGSRIVQALGMDDVIFPCAGEERKLRLIPRNILDVVALNVLRVHPGVSRLNAIERGKFTEAEFYRMVSAVEEANAEFEGFIVRELLSIGQPPTVLGYPVHYSDAVGVGEMFGGMWSDAVVVVRDSDHAVEWAPRHPAAFVRLSFIW